MKILILMFDELWEYGMEFSYLFMREALMDYSGTIIRFSL